MISINLHGEPIVWKRPAHRMLKGRCVIYDEQKKDKEQIRWQMKSYYPSGILITCPVFIEMMFYFKVPESMSKVKRREMLLGTYHHMIKPDIDNLMKFYLDCLTGCVLSDDCIVYGVRGTKLYAEDEYVKICITPEHSLPQKPVCLVEDKLEELRKLFEGDEHEDG